MRLFFLFLSVVMISVFSANAQETKKIVKEKKIIVIEKDKEGKMVRKEIISSDDKDLELDLENFNVDSLIEVLMMEIEGNDKGDKKKARVIIRKSGDKDVEIENFEITKDVEVEIDEESGERHVIIRTNRDGEEEVIEWLGENAPNEFEVEVDESWVDVEELAQPTVSMGLAITEHVTIDAVLEGSAAQKAGLKKGDILKRIDTQIIYSHRGLLEHLTSYKSGNKVLVSFMRNGKEQTTELILEARD